MVSHEHKDGSGTGRLLCLLLVTFVIGTDDFIIAGVLPAIASDLQVSEAAAGQLVTVFSITYAVAAPPIAVATARWPRKTLIVGGLLVFAALNLLTAFAPTYGALLVLRVLAALVGASITPAVFGMAGRLAAPERVGRAMGVVAAGLTVSLFVGVPIGSVLGTTFGWRSTFIAVALLTVAVLVACVLLLPRLPGAPEIGVRRQLSILSRPAVLTCVMGTVMGASGGLLVYTYIGPITEALSGQGGLMLAVFIGTVGVAGAVGTFAGGRLTDRWGADRTLIATFTVLVLATVALSAIGLLGRGTAPVWLVTVALAVYGFAGWGFNPPMNTRALSLAGDAGTEAVALNTSGLYVGIAVAGAVGGGAITLHGGIGAVVAASGIGLVTLVVMALSVRLYPSSIGENAPDGSPFRASA
ncbi:MFS transporter [Nocardiopsis sp. HNM0947]|uniref:MFS transporter n=1 Tax=Nocardiopsis coralli TaxID=2772213 RepID=A0ABR9P3K0_9ACTN|nr:MFS transporter [Nocardiopsis coralli]MBE2998411.1 MFS transporter [Nocardiopsis coralli]